MSMTGKGETGAPLRVPGSPRRVRNFHSHVIWRLGVGIIGGRYPEDTVLPGDAELMAQFGVSRTVLREALKTLSAKGLIEARAGVGTRVLPRSRWNLFDTDVLNWHLEGRFDMDFLAALAEVRMALEPEAAALAANRRTAEHARALEEWVQRMAQSARSAQDFASNDFGFHRTVAEASGNPFMLSISGLVEVALTASFTVSSPVGAGEVFDLVVAHHGDIARAIANGNAEQARSRMRYAIQFGFDRATLALTSSRGLAFTSTSS